MVYLHILFAEIKRSLKESFSYNVGFISSILLLVVLYCSLIFMNTGTLLGSYYKNAEGSKTLLLIGYIFWSYSIIAINEVSSEIEKEAVKGTLEQKFMSIAPYSLLLAGSIISSILVSSVVAGIIITLSRIIFGINIIINPGVILSLFITLLGMYGMGLILGGISFIVKKISKITEIIQIVLLFITDTLTKTSFLKFNWIIPLTLGNDIARRFASSLTVPFDSWIVLVFVSSIWLVTGIAVFNICSKYVKKNGLLGTY
ncbi:ABC transporter permease [Caldanaerobius polysaccharolyticus]|uniref:ABC transporter permease n=1 Tax=Caldanaerobius polysaccharolyticus TaxID=44256 RepID=UPI000559430A|nr:ABC transporter permease [Caldanaerobius polysaccharolyticus]